MKPLRKLSFQKSFSSAGQVKLNIENTIDNAPNAIILLNLMDNAYDKEFKKINTTNEDYPQKLKEHTNLKEWNNKLKDLIMNLTYSMRSPNESTLTIIEQLKSLLNQGITVPENGIPTGAAAGDGDKMVEMVKEVYDYIQEYDKVPHIKMYDDIWWDTQFLISPLSYGKPTLEQLENLYKICGYANKLHNTYYKDKKMTIHSGLRVKAYNEHLKKNNPNVASNSSHIYGKALDFDIEGVSTNELRTKIVGQGFKGMKKSYSTWIHIDLRPSQRGYANDW